MEGPSTVMERVPAPTLEVSMTKEDFLPEVPLSTPLGEFEVIQRQSVVQCGGKPIYPRARVNTVWLINCVADSLTPAEDADGRGVVVAVDAPDDDLEWRPGDVDAVELGVQVVHALLLGHESERMKIRLALYQF